MGPSRQLRLFGASPGLGGLKSVGDLQPTERALKLTLIGLAFDPSDSPAIDSLRGEEKFSCSKAFALCGTWTRSEGGCGDLFLQTVRIWKFLLVGS